MEQDPQQQGDESDMPEPTPVVPARSPIAPSATGLVVGDGTEPVAPETVDDVAPEEETG